MEETELVCILSRKAAPPFVVEDPHLAHLGRWRVANRDIFWPTQQVFEVSKSPHSSPTTLKAGYSSQPLAISGNTPAHCQSWTGLHLCGELLQEVQHTDQSPCQLKGDRSGLSVFLLNPLLHQSLPLFLPCHVQVLLSVSLLLSLLSLLK